MEDANVDKMEWIWGQEDHSTVWEGTTGPDTSGRLVTGCSMRVPHTFDSGNSAEVQE